MVDVPDSGMEDAMVTTTDLDHKKNAKMFALNHKEKVCVYSSYFWVFPRPHMGLRH